MSSTRCRAQIVSCNLLAGYSRACRAMLHPRFPGNARKHRARDLTWLMYDTCDVMTNEPRNHVLWRRLLFCTIRPCTTYQEFIPVKEGHTASIEVVRMFLVQDLTGGFRLRLQVTIPGTSPPPPYTSSAPCLFSASHYFVVPNERFRPRSFNSLSHTYVENA